MTSNFAYSTGRPITFPVAFYEFNNTTRVYYSNRNEYRIPDYMRLDLSATLNGNLKAKKLNHSSLHLLFIMFWDGKIHIQFSSKMRKE